MIYRHAISINVTLEKLYNIVQRSLKSTNSNAKYKNHIKQFLFVQIRRAP